MKKLLIATIASLFILGITVSSFAADLTTGLTATVTQFTSFALKEPGIGIRSTTAVTFKTVDGTALKGWYYNTLATLDGTTGDPIDNKSDVGLGVKSNVKFNLSIKKSADTLDGKVGYFVDKAYNWNGATSDEVTGVVTGTGFAGTTTWGTLTTAPASIFVGTAAYADFSMGASFALVPGSLGIGPYSTTITYTMTPVP